MALFYRACVYDGDKTLFRDDAGNYHNETAFDRRRSYSATCIYPIVA